MVNLSWSPLHPCGPAGFPVIGCPYEDRNNTMEWVHALMARPSSVAGFTGMMDTDWDKTFAGVTDTAVLSWNPANTSLPFLP